MPDRGSAVLATAPAAAEASKEPDKGFRLGPITVGTGAALTREFAAALGLRDGFGPVPLTFPVRWLCLPEVHCALADGLDVRERILLQRSQSFTYRQPLDADREYRFGVVVRRDPAAPELVSIGTTVDDDGGNVVVASETGLYIVDGERAPRVQHRLPLAEGGALVELQLGPVSLDQTRRYAAISLDDNPVHRDLAAARSIGMDCPIVHGMWVMGQFERALFAWRPDLRVTRLAGVFLQPLPVGTGIAVGCRLGASRRIESGERLCLRMIARTTADDVPICVGDVEALAAAGPVHATDRP